MTGVRPAARSGFVPWSLPVGGGIAAGVWFSSGVEVLAAAAVVAGVLLLVAGRAAARAKRGRRERGDVVTLFLVALAVGVLRHEIWDARPDPVALLLGRETTWHGRYDGEWFYAREPVRARLALVTGIEPQPGRLSISGTARRPPGKRNPGGFDYAAYLARRGVSAQLFVEEFLGAAPRVGVRHRIARGVAAGLKPAVAGLQLAMTLGLRDDLTSAERDTFRQAGLAHVLALSGLHFGVLLAAAGRVLRPLGLHRRAALVVLTCAFVALVGPAPSVLRAAAMALAALLAMSAGVGRLEPWPVLALSACISLMVQPQMLFDLSFQLSYLALAGILALAGPAARRLGADGADPDPLLPELPGSASGGFTARARSYAVQALCASLAAQLPSLSLVAGSFGSVPLLSPLVNLVGVPLSAVLVPLGFLAGLLGLVWEPLAAALNVVTGIFGEGLVALAQAGSRLPSVGWAEVGWLGHLCWAAFVIAVALWLHGRLSVGRALLVTLVASTIPQAVGSATPPPDVWFLDVGQGDATLIRLGGQNVLVDGGGSPFSDYDVGSAIMLPALRALGVRDLDVVIATHPDADHVEGLFSVLRALPVGTLVTGPPAPGNPLDEQLRELAQEGGLPVHVATRGEALVLDERGEARLEVLHPPAGPPDEPGNEASVVVLLRYRGQPSALLLADVGSVTEEDLALGRVRVLKVGHHGSRFSTSETLLAATHPELAVISVGENRYGHPHPTVVERLSAHNVPVVTTQEAGAVRLALEGPR